MRIERIDRIGLELGTESNSRYHVKENDPLSAVAELRRTQTMSRDAWQIRVDTWMLLSCTRNAPGKEQKQPVVANGIAPFLEISDDNPSKLADCAVHGSGWHKDDFGDATLRRKTGVAVGRALPTALCMHV